MKKKVLLIGICLLLLAMPFASAQIAHLRMPTTRISNQTSVVPTLEAPDWAKGNFSGVWGITVLGVPAPPIGWINGYYENIGFGKLEAEYALFNTTNATASLGGIMLWIFFFGGVKNYVSGNSTWVSGIGVANETHYYLRLNAIIGPSYYMHVQYTKFEG